MILQSIPTPDDLGFSLVELVVSLGLALTVAGVAATFLDHAASAAVTQPEHADASQRARVALDQLRDDIGAAGAGLDVDADAGALVRMLPPILPRRVGLLTPDGPAVARGDVLTVITTAPAGAQGALASAFGAASPVLALSAAPQCATGAHLCGLVASETAIVTDATGRFGLFEVVSVSPGVGLTRALDPSSSHVFQPGDWVGEGRVRVFYHDAARRQLRVYDGNRSDVPVVDEVVAVSFAYAGDPAPPTWPRPPLGTANCLIDATGLPQAGLVDLRGAGAGSIVPLPIAMFQDGPWCGVDGTRFDADLLRIRRVTVDLRVQAGVAMRGTGTEYAIAGHSRSARRAVPDVALRFDVSPPNLQVLR